jgi:protein tyrosine phosphatase (PTP) superfamily phosphohydrolase (DUF442 family)
MRNKKRIQKNLLKPKQIALIVLFIVLVLAGYVYFLFLKPITPDSNFAAVRVAGAAENPNSPEVEKVLQSGKAVRIDLAGCPNLCKVSDTLYRGAQPTEEGFANLKKLGIKTIISLRDHHSDKTLLVGTGLSYIPMATDTWEITPAKAAGFLRVAVDPNAAPVYVHCQHGADRTGAMVAAYRMVIQDVEKKKAIREMTHGGFGFHPLWTELPDFLRRLDVDAMKKQLGQAPNGSKD